MTKYAIGLGSNLGDRLGYLRTAVQRLAEVGHVIEVSPLYQTEPVGGPDQGPYYNAIAVIESDLGAVSMLEACHSLEVASGRVRGERWGPRTLDVDLVTSDGPTIAEDQLILPHPLATQREFVLRPLADVWPDAPFADGLVASEALARLEQQGVSFIEDDWV